MSYRLIDANDLNGKISEEDYKVVLDAPCIYADLPNGLDNEYHEIPKWIPISEGLPEDDTRVLITTTSALGTEHIVLEVSYLNGVFLRGFSSYTPSAWMPLPEAYKEERNANDS